MAGYLGYQQTDDLKTFIAEAQTAGQPLQQSVAGRKERFGLTTNKTLIASTIFQYLADEGAPQWINACIPLEDDIWGEIRLYRVYVITMHKLITMHPQLFLGEPDLVDDPAQSPKNPGLEALDVTKEEFATYDHRVHVFRYSDAVHFWSKMAIEEQRCSRSMLTKVFHAKCG